MRVTQLDNCVLFDARLAHQGAALDRPRPNLKLCLAFINADACKEHLRVVERCLKRRTMNLRVADLLKEQIQSHEPSVQLESASSKRKAEQGAQIPKRRGGRVRGSAGLPPQQAGDGDHRRIARDDDTRQGQWQGRRSTRRRAGAGQQ